MPYIIRSINLLLDHVPWPSVCNATLSGCIIIRNSRAFCKAHYGNQRDVPYHPRISSGCLLVSTALSCGDSVCSVLPDRAINACCTVLEAQCRNNGQIGNGNVGLSQECGPTTSPTLYLYFFHGGARPVFIRVHYPVLQQ